MEKVSSLGLMDANMKEITLMIKSKDGVFSPGLMAESTKDTGTMASNMDKAFTIHQKEKLKKVSGKKGRGQNGYKILQKELCNEIK